ncbi:MAG TPA: rhodanese-like domain-containing protein [Anaerolineae bacterium]|nr:rhodanese-like domain-containing protein [Anaerolineae bacterium]HNU03302.1 rhodanese-like domain-containing protein [Anaerolineae bacterium]
MKREEMLIEPDELLARLGDPKLRIYDSTIMFYMGMSAEEAAKMPTAHEVYLQGHIPGAAFFDHQLFSDVGGKYAHTLAPDEILAAQIGQIGIGNHAEVIVYASGLLASATRAWWILHYAGVQHVRVLNGGLPAWREAGGALATGEQKYDPASFTAAFKPEMFASREEVQAALGQGTVVIENALTQDWHDQEHIPGSTCLPLTDLTVGWDILRSQDEISALVAARPKGERIITYCGGGIAATLNAMAHLMVGNENVAVYDGSLFEWKGEGLPLSSSPAMTLA